MELPKKLFHRYKPVTVSISKGERQERTLSNRPLHICYFLSLRSSITLSVCQNLFSAVYIHIVLKYTEKSRVTLFSYQRIICTINKIDKSFFINSCNIYEIQ